MKKDIVCILCPRGCKLIVDDETYEVMGQGCRRGLQFGAQEIINPMRMLTTTAKISNALHKQIPVRSTGPIAFDKIFECTKEIKKLNVQAPVKVGQVLIKNILNTGIDVIASRSL